MAAHGIGEVRSGSDAAGHKSIVIDRHRWYSQQRWLDAFADISQALGGGLMFKIGCQVPSFAPFPPQGSDDASTIHEGLRALDVAYHMNHRRAGKVMYNTETGAMLEGIGHYILRESSDDRHIVMCCENPYPCDFDRGILHTIASHFEPSAETTHDRTLGCRKHGADSCTYNITW